MSGEICAIRARMNPTQISASNIPMRAIDGAMIAIRRGIRAPVDSSAQIYRIMIDGRAIDQIHNKNNTKNKTKIKEGIKQYEPAHLSPIPKLPMVWIETEQLEQLMALADICASLSLINTILLQCRNIRVLREAEPLRARTAAGDMLLPEHVILEVISAHRTIPTKFYLNDSRSSTAHLHEKHGKKMKAALRMMCLVRRENVLRPLTLSA